MAKKMAIAEVKDNRTKSITDKISVSIIIPTHKTNMKYFLRCFNSIKKQTFGFQNIEVIIVVHNTGTQVFENIETIVEDYTNVKLLNLNNDKSSASSPRNYGMKFVTTKYVAFLDDDDAIKENFINDAFSYMQHHNVQFISYARENLKDDNNIVSIKYNELETKCAKEVIYKTKGNENIIPFEQAVFVTGKLFDFDFIKKHQILFDEDIPVFEDFLFVSNVIKYSNAICVQPHILGYSYHLNQDSIINNLNRTDKDILNCVNGILSVIKSMKSSQYLAQIELRELVAYVGVTLFSSFNISYLTRLKIKDLIKEYINLLWIVDKNNIYAKTRNKMNYKIMEVEIMHPIIAYLVSKSLKLLKINPIRLVSFFTNRFD